MNSITEWTVPHTKSVVVIG
ncbi:hypothetical protein A2U01_0072359, partial [Trifolium medium]|nr:hypothetical protein [Trifolium medium]